MTTELEKQERSTKNLNELREAAVRISG